MSQGRCPSRSEHGMGLAAAGYGLVAPSITPSFPSHWLLAMQVLTAEEGFNLTSCCSWLHLPVVPVVPAKQDSIMGGAGPSPHTGAVIHLPPLVSRQKHLLALPLFSQPLQVHLPFATFQHPYCKSVYIARRPHLPYAKERQHGKSNRKVTSPCALFFATERVARCFYHGTTSPLPHASPVSSLSSHHTPS